MGLSYWVSQIRKTAGLLSKLLELGTDRSQESDLKEAMHGLKQVKNLTGMGTD